MHWCLRLSPLVAFVLIVLHARSLLHLVFGIDDGLSLALVPGSGVVSEVFAWIYLTIGVGLVWALVSHFVEEFKFDREINRNNRAHLTRRLPPESRRAWKR